MVRKNKLIDACLNGNGDVFEEIRKMRKVNKSLPHTMDGQTNVTERFKKVYQKLYNSVNDEQETQEVLKLVNNHVDVSSLDDVDLVNQSVVRKAVDNIKLHKNDPIFTFNSDCIKRAPASLFQHLSLMMKCFLIHGHVSQVLLLATMVPLIKNKLGDSETSDNYRSIALSSVILKIFDWIVLLLFGENLGYDDLQFNYQQNCSTTMCTWLMVESTNYFLRNGSNVYSCFMDMRKAFDTVQHSKLFQKLNQRNLSSIITRLIIVMYVSQSANVRWGKEVSKSFMITNGVKQGAVLPAILFCVYIDELITKLRRNKTGCWIDGNFVGIIVYADDIVLLPPTLGGLQEMIDICSDYAGKHNLSFSTNENPNKSKTKCIAFLKKKELLARKMFLEQKPLPWVTSIKHLGVTINDKMNIGQDIMEKRAQYIVKINELMQEFHFAEPSLVAKLNDIYNTHFYGAPLWDLFSNETTKLVGVWNTSHRILFRLARSTHGYLIEPLSERPHIMISIWKRFHKFCSSIESSKKFALRHIYHLIKNDCRATTGKNIRNIMLKTNAGTAPYYVIPDGEIWRVLLIRELIDIKSGRMTSEFATEEIESILELACCC